MMSVANVHKHISVMQNKVVRRRLWSSSSIWSVTGVKSKNIYPHYDPSSNTLLLIGCLINLPLITSVFLRICVSHRVLCNSVSRKDGIRYQRGLWSSMNLLPQTVQSPSSGAPYVSNRQAPTVLGHLLQYYYFY